MVLLVTKTRKNYENDLMKIGDFVCKRFLGSWIPFWIFHRRLATNITLLISNMGSHVILGVDGFRY